MAQREVAATEAPLMGACAPATEVLLSHSDAPADETSTASTETVSEVCSHCILTANMGC